MADDADIRGFPRLMEAEELFREGRKDQASLKVIEHLRQHRDEPRGLALLGEMAMENGALVQAEQFLRRAARQSASMEVKRNLAAVLLQQDRLDAALEAYTYLEREDEGLAASAARAIILDRLGHSDEAIAIYERVVADPRADAKHWIAYGHSLRFAGRTADAIAAYRHVTDADPERGEAWWGLADIKSQVLTDDDVQRMEEALGIAVDALNIVPLHMALARAWHDRGDHERAFGHYREGNRIRAEVIRYDPAELSREVDEFVRMPVPGDGQDASSAAGPIPIFLISLPRSGSTLLEQILGRHPDVQALGELPYVRAVMRASLEVHMQRGALTVPQYIGRLTVNEKRALGAEYLRRAAMHRRVDTPYFIDKMPSNWSDILFIRAILPQARFVEIRRNAMDCAFSNYTHHFSSAHAASFDLVNQAQATIDYTRLMDHVASAAPGMICQVRYEKLLDHPERELRRVLDYLGLEWSDDLLSFHESDRTVRTPSAEQVRRPLNRSGVDRWKPYAQWLRPLRDALGPLADA
ncbi:tetratricopeptide repeat-containing sulfotransferase family protein [Sphingomonas flavescens]|uniref:tetratricopeptide repeat-containing sulfotransferase family protein n=1 Tax=Sphingomonas flavescens TaxID=3132797 RepID=UPI002805F6FB|nr:sulfotransferase [Sphingomonas limnosediminicola]